MRHLHSVRGVFLSKLYPSFWRLCCLSMFWRSSLHHLWRDDARLPRNQKTQVGGMDGRPNEPSIHHLWEKHQLQGKNYIIYFITVILMELSELCINLNNLCHCQSYHFKPCRAFQRFHLWTWSSCLTTICWSEWPRPSNPLSHPSLLLLVICWCTTWITISNKNTYLII